MRPLKNLPRRSILVPHFVTNKDHRKQEINDGGGYRSPRPAGRKEPNIKEKIGTFSL
jgi:hypothetical protein